MPLASRSLFTLLLAGTVCLAQSDTGSIAGRVSDPSDAPLAAAKVTLTNEATGVSLPAATNQDGLYEYSSLRVGSYTLEVERPGFKRTLQSGIIVSVATRSTVNLVLTIGDVQQTVTVTAQAPVTDTETSDIGTIFQPKFMQDVPLFVTGGFRNPENFISYVPGVNNGQQDSSINGGGGPRKGSLVDGARPNQPGKGGGAL